MKGKFIFFSIFKPFLWFSLYQTFVQSQNITSILTWKENIEGGASKCALLFINIQGYSFGSFQEVGEKFCQVRDCKRVSKRKTSGKKAHFEPVSFVLSVLL